MQVQPTSGRPQRAARPGLRFPRGLSPAGCVTCLVLLCLAALPGVALPGSLTLQHIYFGEAVADQFGFALARAGDVNGDGFEDFLVGANVNDEAITSGGRAYLFLGGWDYPLATGLTFTGEVERGYAGGAVAGGADLNQDGYADWAVGAPGMGADGTHPGRVYVFLGGAEPDALPELILEGDTPAGQFGAAVCLVPDLDGDGYGDLVVGAPRAGNGRVFIFRGGPVPWDGMPDRLMHARQGDERFGKALAYLPDDDGDGRDDLLVGAPRSSQVAAWAGATLVFRGTADLDTVPDLTLLGEAAGDEFGSSLSAGRDLDGDGEPDLLVGAPLANVSGQVDVGKAYLFRGGGTLDHLPDLIFTGQLSGDRFGKSVGIGFDWNGDGYADMAVGASGFDNGESVDAGACLVYLGGDLLDAQADTIIDGGGTQVHLGMSTVDGGDIRHNGRATLLVGGYHAADTGRVMLFGSAEPPTAVGEGPSLVPAGLAAPWPNPFNPQVQTCLTLREPGFWRLAVYDLRGRQVRQLGADWFSAGQYSFFWNGTDEQGTPQPSSRYFLQARGPRGSLCQPLTLIR